MPTLSINHRQAVNILEKAFYNQIEINDMISVKIRSVLFGNHKTYKYVLVNGLLAKATNEHCNPIALQAGAEIDGSFDARSLCHDVIVPFERKHLQNALGGSNEPFLNKPARFKTMSPDNAVRKGNDRRIMLTVIDVFNSINNSEEAFAYLSHSMKLLAEKAVELEKLNKIEFDGDPTVYDISEFLDMFLSKSFEGETAVIVSSALERSFLSHDPNYRVNPHKVNQSGASSKESGDVDVYYKESLLYSIEVKDKAFYAHDIEHAAKKALRDGCNKLDFIYGPASAFDRKEIGDFIAGFSKEHKFFIAFNSIHYHAFMLLLRLNMNNKSELFDIMMDIAVEINSKEETRLWLQESIDTYPWTK